MSVKIPRAVYISCSLFMLFAFTLSEDKKAGKDTKLSYQGLAVTGIAAAYCLFSYGYKVKNANRVEAMIKDAPEFKDAEYYVSADGSSGVAMNTNTMRLYLANANFKTATCNPVDIRDVELIVDQKTESKIKTTEYDGVFHDYERGTISSVTRVKSIALKVNINDVNVPFFNIVFLAHGGYRKPGYNYENAMKNGEYWRGKILAMAAS